MSKPRKPTATENRNKIRSEATRGKILAAAYSQFVNRGFDGARMETIASEARVNKALVYRHFGNRENLYMAVLAQAYERIREQETQLEVPDDPIRAICAIVDFTLNYYIENPDFLVLVGIENLNKGIYLEQIERDVLKVQNLEKRYGKIIQSGQDKGLFRDGLLPADLYTMVASQCWFTVATRYSFGNTFQVDVLEKNELLKRIWMIRRAVFGYVLRDEFLNGILEKCDKPAPTALLPVDPDE